MMYTIVINITILVLPSLKTVRKLNNNTKRMEPTTINFHKEALYMEDSSDFGLFGNNEFCSTCGNNSTYILTFIFCYYIYIYIYSNET